MFVYTFSSYDYRYCVLVSCWPFFGYFFTLLFLLASINLIQTITLIAFVVNLVSKFLGHVDSYGSSSIKDNLGYLDRIRLRQTNLLSSKAAIFVQSRYRRLSSVMFTLPRSLIVICNIHFKILFEYTRSSITSSLHPCKINQYKLCTTSKQCQDINFLVLYFSDSVSVAYVTCYICIPVNILSIMSKLFALTKWFTCSLTSSHQDIYLIRSNKAAWLSRFSSCLRANSRASNQSYQCL